MSTPKSGKPSSNTEVKDKPKRQRPRLLEDTDPLFAGENAFDPVEFERLYDNDDAEG